MTSAAVAINYKKYKPYEPGQFVHGEGTFICEVRPPLVGDLWEIEGRKVVQMFAGPRALFGGRAVPFDEATRAVAELNLCGHSGWGLPDLPVLAGRRPIDGMSQGAYQFAVTEYEKVYLPNLFDLMRAGILRIPAEDTEAFYWTRNTGCLTKITNFVKFIGADYETCRRHVAVDFFAERGISVEISQRALCWPVRAKVFDLV